MATTTLEARGCPSGLTPPADEPAGDAAAFVQHSKDGVDRLELMVEGASCAACIKKIESAMLALPGVRDARLNLSTRRLRVDWTPGAVEALKTHPDFDLRNPNRVRALISSFAGNQVRFHDASGAGYRVYADTIIQLDPTNGQVAARMVSPLGQWRRFDAGRRELMKRELQRILDLPGLSRNTFEMASKSIA